MRVLLLAACLLLFGSVMPGRSEETVDRAAAIFRARALGVDPSSDEDVARLRDDLLALGPEAWSEVVLSGSLRRRSGNLRRMVRLALVRSLSDADVARMIDAASSRPDDAGDRLVRLLRNLRGRDGLGTALIEREAFEAAALGNDQVVADVAGEDLLSGDRTLAMALLSDPRFVDRAASELSDLPYEDGLCLIADVLTGNAEVPEAARDALASFDPNLSDIRHRRPLGARRRAGVLSVAENDPDPALRATAARILHYENVVAGAGAAFGAKALARTHRLEDESWDWLAGELGPPPASARIPRHARARCLPAWIRFSHVRASDDPADAEDMAREVRALYARTADDRTRGALLRALTQAAYAFRDSRHGRQRLVPSFDALLEDLAAGRPGTSPSLRSLEAWWAGRTRTELERGGPPNPPNTFRIEESPVLALISAVRSGGGGLIDPRESVERWLEVDPGHLHDHRVRRGLVGWTGRRALADILAAYPEAAIRRMLDEPPITSREDDGTLAVQDPTGSRARGPLLVFLRHDPRQAARLAQADLVRGWPGRDRHLAGALRHRLAPDEEPGPSFADDAFAAGFLLDALGDYNVRVSDVEPATPGPRDLGLRFAARVVARADERPVLRAMLLDSDAADEALPINVGLQLDEPLREALARVMVEDADPRAGMLAARLLSATGRADAFDAVFRADAWLECSESRGHLPASDLASLVRDDATRDAVLRYVAGPQGMPDGRVEAFEQLAAFEWIDEEDDERAGRLRREHAYLTAWVQEHLATLVPDVAEGVALTWLRNAPAYDDDRLSAAVATAVRKGLVGLPDGAVKRRIRAWLDTP